MTNWVRVGSREGDLGQTAGDTGLARHPHVHAAGGHDASSPILFNDLVPVVDPPARGGIGEGIASSMSRDVFVGNMRLIFLLLLLCLLFLVLSGLCPRLSDRREDRHGQGIECGLRRRLLKPQRVPLDP